MKYKDKIHLESDITLLASLLRKRHLIRHIKIPNRCRQEHPKIHLFSICMLKNPQHSPEVDACALIKLEKYLKYTLLIYTKMEKIIPKQVKFR